jgi:hypothetical protein
MQFLNFVCVFCTKPIYVHLFEVFTPTDAHFFFEKRILNSFNMFRCNHHPQGVHYMSLLKLGFLKGQLK